MYLCLIIKVMYNYLVKKITKSIGWYPVSKIGWALTFIYTGSFIYIKGIEKDFFFYEKLLVVTSVVIITVVMFVAHRAKLQPFSKGKSLNKGFSLIELLIVISIIGILTSIAVPALFSVKSRAYLAKARAEFRSLEESLQLYIDDYGAYPNDADRNIPPGLEEYLAPGIWPDAAWPGSVFDWDNWASSQLTHEPKEQVYQISVRFCPIGGTIDECNFPNEDWAEDFDVNSAVYYCIQGPCRSHSSQPVDHPGYCVNCQ